LIKSIIKKHISKHPQKR